MIRRHWTGRSGVTVAIVESPFQMLSLIEAVDAGMVEPTVGIVSRVAAPSSSGLDLMRNCSVLSAAWDLDPEFSPDLVRSLVEADRLVVGDAFSGLAQVAIAARHGGPTTLIDDGSSILYAADALVTGRRFVRPRGAGGGFRASLGWSARQGLVRSARSGELTVFSALLRAEDVPSATLVENRFGWTKRVELRDRCRLQRNVVLGSSLAVDGMIATDRYHEWLHSVVSRGQTSFLPHRRERSDVRDLVRDLGGEVLDSAGHPAELVLRNAPERTVCHTLPSTAVLTLARVNPRLDVRCERVPATWWSPAAPVAIRSLVARIATNADRDLQQVTSAATVAPLALAT